MPENSVAIMHLAPGQAPGCADCPENGYADDEGYFTWSNSCPGCSEPLAGDHYPTHVVFTDNSYDHINVCPDCLMSIAYDDPEDRIGRIMSRYSTPAAD